jgi:tetratricopeptide (TPR) repeat protein
MADSAGMFRTDGNDLFNRGDLAGAIEKYSAGLELSSDDILLYSNRSAALCLLKHYDLALEDANACIRLSPSWGKGYIRKCNVLWATDRIPEAITACEAGLQLVDENDKESLKVMVGRCSVELYKLRLRGAWTGQVSEEMGAYVQTLTFGSDNNVRIDVFGRHQNCQYSVDLSKSPAHLTIKFGADTGFTSVPYIIEFRDDDNSLAICCPFLVPEIPQEFDGPGFVLMRRSNGDPFQNPDAIARKKLVEGVDCAEERMRMYLEDFANILAASAHSMATCVAPGIEAADEVEANKKVLQVMSIHAKISELEGVYGASIPKNAFAIISGADDFHRASRPVQAEAERLRDLLLSTGFITPEGLREACAHYSKNTTQKSERYPNTKVRLQKKLLKRRTNVATGHIEVESSTPSTPGQIIATDRVDASSHIPQCPTQVESNVNRTPKPTYRVGASMATVAVAACCLVALGIGLKRLLVR